MLVILNQEQVHCLSARKIADIFGLLCVWYPPQNCLSERLDWIDATVREDMCHIYRGRVE
ncbi:MAG: hypothetical protein NVSMB52_08460 [Chloroflexota bacterium]